VTAAGGGGVGGGGWGGGGGGGGGGGVGPRFQGRSSRWLVVADFRESYGVGQMTLKEWALSLACDLRVHFTVPREGAQKVDGPVPFWAAGRKLAFKHSEKERGESTIFPSFLGGILDCAQRRKGTSNTPWDNNC